MRSNMARYICIYNGKNRRSDDGVVYWVGQGVWGRGHRPPQPVGPLTQHMWGGPSARDGPRREGAGEGGADLRPEGKGSGPSAREGRGSGPSARGEGERAFGPLGEGAGLRPSLGAP